MRKMETWNGLRLISTKASDSGSHDNPLRIAILAFPTAYCLTYQVSDPGPERLTTDERRIKICSQVFDPRRHSQRKVLEMKSIVSTMVLGTLFSAAMLAQSRPASVSARAGIDAGNQAWIDGVKTGNIALIIATYADDAVDCSPSGECVRGRLEIERHMKTQLASLGPARSAAVASAGSTQQGNFAYEWGQAEATYAGGKRLVEKYLTVWQRQPDGNWKIFRNLVIPDR